jgi:phosphotransferase system IIB component
MKMHFDNTVEKDSTLKQYTRKLVFEMVKNIQVIFGKGTVKEQKKKKTPTLTDIPFKKQSIFSSAFLTGRTFKLVTTLI